MSKFHTFGAAVRKRFGEMATEALFEVATDRDGIWEHYLRAFPAGTNPMFRARTEHDCSCCRGFIRNVGGIVTVQNGALSTIWDLNGLPSPYQEVADAMSTYIKALPICDVFLTKAHEYGQEHSTELLDSGKVHRWEHFSVKLPANVTVIDPVAQRGDLRTTQQVLMRGFTELTPEALQTVTDLINENALYRGQEHKRAVGEFHRLQSRWLAGDERTQAALAWSLVRSPVARFRNTAIGTLVQDLSSGVDIERAVKAFETKVAPTNYKRPTALITQRMVDDAMKTIQELNLEDALERRHARLSDVQVTSVLFVDNAARKRMKGGVADLLAEEVKPVAFDLKKAKEISIGDFVSKVLPKTTALSLFLENRLQPNFVSLTAPVHEDVEPLFRWPNNFAWSYEGNVTDSIKEKVKRAGGKVEGVVLRVSLAWDNYDDLDLHIKGPKGEHIYYGDKHGRSGGYLDVDMNAGGGQTREPVENVRWAREVPTGTYSVGVHQYARRETIDVGFTVEIEAGGEIYTLSYPKAVTGGIAVAELAVNRDEIAIKPFLAAKEGGASQNIWGLKTQDLVRVNSIVLSPNHWDTDGDRYGNKHWFFVLEGCVNPEPTRGMYNEYLHPRLDKHRKVFEVLGNKTKCPPVPDQMSGVGFSSTVPNKVSVIAMGPKLNQPYTIVF